MNQFKTMNDVINAVRRGQISPLQGQLYMISAQDFEQVMGDPNNLKDDKTLLQALTQMAEPLMKDEEDDVCTCPDCQCEPTQEEEESNLPEWARKRIQEGILEPYVALETRDGRNVGNATIIDLMYNVLTKEPQFRIITHTGVPMTCTLDALIEYFHTPEFVVWDYPNNDNGQMDDIIDTWMER